MITRHLGGAALWHLSSARSLAGVIVYTDKKHQPMFPIQFADAAALPFPHSFHCGL